MARVRRDRQESMIRLAGFLISPKQLPVLVAIGQCDAPPKIGRFHRRTENNLEKDGIVRRVAFAEGSKIPAWVVTAKGRRMLDDGVERGVLPKPAEPVGVAHERI